MIAKLTAWVALAAALCLSGAAAPAATVVATSQSSGTTLAETLDFSWTASGVITPLAPGQFAGTATAQFNQFGQADFTISGAAGAAIDGVTPVSGDFTFDFGGDSFMGTFIGENFPRDSMTQLALFTRVFTILGGTGIFDGASGTMVGAGSTLFTQGAQPPLTFSVTGQGLVSAPGLTAAIPEPSTWAMMIAGFGFVGAAARVRARKVAFA